MTYDKDIAARLVAEALPLATGMERADDAPVAHRLRAMAEQLRAAMERIDILGATACRYDARVARLHSALGSALALTYVPDHSHDEEWHAERERLTRILDGENQ